MSGSNTPPQALYQQAKSYVQSKLLSGEWKSGDMIPSENRLVSDLSMSRMTVNRALRELAAEGLLTRIAGVGTFVAAEKPQSNLLMIANIGDEIRQRGHVYRCDVISVSRESASMAVAAAIGLPTGHSVFHVVCVHYEEETAVQLEDRYVNPEMVPEFLNQTFSEALPPSLYLLKNVPVEEMEHIVDATLPSTEEARLLEITEQTPCLVLMRRTWTNSKTVTYVRFLHPSSRYRLGSRMMVTAENRAG
jgi:GntR family transcriptional regulator, histidine utilization repressor